MASTQDMDFESLKIQISWKFKLILENSVFQDLRYSQSIQKIEESVDTVNQTINSLIKVGKKEIPLCLLKENNQRKNIKIFTFLNF